MPREGDKWRVARGDCLWNIARAVYGNGARWPEIAAANGLPTSGSPIIHPGQLFTLPGITASSVPAPAPAPPPPPPAYTYQPNIVWFSLQAGSNTHMEAIWEQSHNKFETRWEIWDNSGHLWMAAQNFVTTYDAQKSSDHDFSNDRQNNTRHVIRFSVRAVDDNNNYLSPWAYKEFDLRNAPPGLINSPNVSIDKNNYITVTFDNIPEDINADSIEIAIYQDDTFKYTSVTIPIDFDSRFAKYTGELPAGHQYKVRCRAVKGGSNYGPWTDFTSNDQTLPIAPEEITILRPQVINEQGSKTYGIFVEWTESLTAKTYEVQYTTQLSYFENESTGDITSVTTEEGKGPRILIANVETGHEYFFRVRSVNDKGSSNDFTPIKSIKVGSKPSAPTTWSNASTAILGETINLYWTHNSTDGALESVARLEMSIYNPKYPEMVPTKKTEVIHNDRSGEEQAENSVYVIDTNDQEWSLLDEGFVIRWKVQTCGLLEEYSDWSVEREIYVYKQPTVSVDIKNNQDFSVNEIDAFPFYLTILAEPSTQKPISYYIEIVSNNSYETVDDVGNVKNVELGDKVYQRYYDPPTNAWRLMLEMTPDIIDLQDDCSYTVNVTVTMDSGLTASDSTTFDVYFNDLYYDVYADIIIDRETLTAAIHPYCNGYVIDTYGETHAELYKDCTLAIYRREYDGTYTKIEDKIPNEKNMFITDPHPSLDYARYRIVAKTNDTGAISYSDVPGVEIHEPSVVMQWADKWTNFEYDDSGKGNMEPKWAGSMIKIPYNIDTSENRTKDVSLVEYVGRKHPVSYYGTHIGETAEWSVEIPAYDKELIYQLRRLAIWNDKVYVREQSGVGYWANVEVSFNQKHLAVTIPVSFSITRIEGGY